MDSAKRHRLLVLIIGAFVVFAASPAWAGYPPEPQDCADVNGEVTVQDGQFVFEVEGGFSLFGGPGCGSGTSGHIDGQSHRFTFDNSTFAVAADGSYASPTLRLPSHMGPGPHRLFAVFLNADGTPAGEVVVPIFVVDTSDTGGGLTDTDPNGGGGGGGLASTSSGGGGGGILPRTGGSILMLILWALALLAAGTALVFAARRRGFRWEPARATGRARKRAAGIRALPPPDVPFIDTRGFVPVKPGSAQHGPDLVTEADLMQRNESDGE